MKKLFVLIMAILLVLGLAACGGTSTTQPAVTQPVQPSEKPAANAPDARTTPSAQITQEQLDKIKKIAAQITPLYNKALTKAQENGWTNDEKTYQELAAIQALVQWTTESLANPSMYNDITDKDDYIKSMQEILDAMPSLVDRVSTPKAG